MFRRRILQRPQIYAIGFFVFICWIIYLANHHYPSPFFEFCKSLPFGDKLGHAGLYGMLALLANLSLNHRHWKRSWLLLGSVAVLTFALGEELTQHFNPHRTMDWVDATADVVGIAVATAVSLLLKTAGARDPATEV